MTDKLFNLIKKITPIKWHGSLENNGVKRYFANMGWMFGGQMLSLLVSFFIGAWIARYLGPENYGVLSYSIAFVGIFGFIASLGVDGILNRDLVENPERRDELLGTAFRLKLIGGAIAFSLSILGVLIIETDPLVKILVALFSFSFITQSIGVIGTYFNAEVKAKNNVKAQLFSMLITSILKVVVILLGKGIIWLVVVFVLDSIWNGIGLLKAYKDFGLKINNWKFDKTLANNLFKNSWPLMLASAAGFITLKVDQVLIGQMLGSREVGIYAAAVKLVEVWYFIPGIICTALFPAILNAKKVSEESYRRRLKNFYLLMFLIPFLMAIPISLLAKPIIQIFFGNGYLESVPILHIYIWSSIGFFLGDAVVYYLMSEKLSIKIFWFNLCAMIVNVILNLIFIPMFGLVGSAWATMVSYMIVPGFILIIKK